MDTQEKVVTTIKNKVTKKRLAPVDYTQLGEKYGKSTVALLRTLLNNVDLKRYTSLNIINWLRQKKVIEAGKTYVNFQFNKFTVSVNGLNRDFSYKEKFFINCFVASIKTQATFLQKVINGFVDEQFANVEEQIVNNEFVDEVYETGIKNIHNELDTLEKEEPENYQASV